MREDILKIIDKYQEKAVEWRRDFHKYAELGWREFRTTSKIVDILRENNVPVYYGRQVVNPEYAWSYPEQEIASEMERAIRQGADKSIVEGMKRYTGAAAIIDSGKAGPVVALRFDIDALGVREASECGHAPYDNGYASVNPGVMHACGHDGHTAMGLVLALVLNEIKDQLTGKIKIIFQPGEEGALGGQAVSESGILDDVDIFISGHLGMGIPTNSLAVFSQGYLASTKFDLTFEGTSAHAGAFPQTGRNAILAASSAILAMYSFCQDARGATRVNVGKISGGTGRNVVADRVDIQMETRGTTDEIEERLHKACLDSANGAAQMYGCTVKAETKGYASYVICDESLAPYISAAAERVEDIKTVIPSVQSSASEDVGYLMRKVREHGGMAAFMGLGADITAPHHNEKFDFDEKAILIGAKVYTEILLEIMR